MKTTHKLRNSLLLLLTATIWGIAFVAQSVSMEYIKPFTFNFIRCFIGGIVLIPVIYFFGRNNTKTASADEPKDCGIARPSWWNRNKTILIGGILCGSCLFIASNLQQFGIMTTSAGKAGFITACYIVIVPIIGLFFRKKTGPFVWIGVMIALVGMYFLCVLPNAGNSSDGSNMVQLGALRLSIGEILLFLCAIAFSCHILIIDHFSPLVNGVKLSCIQFFVCGILSGICTFLFEQPVISDILSAWIPILYAGAMSCGVAYTLQIIGQKGLDPTIASLIMSLESVISVLAGWLILKQVLSVYEIIGCILIFCALVFAQLPEKKKA